MREGDGLNILVVDDEEIVLYTLKAFLENLGSHVTVVNDGMTGLETLQNGNYNAAFIDYRIPGIDGLSLLRQIREIQPDLCIIIISGSVYEETRIEAIQEGAFAYLKKPFTFINIQKVIADIRAFL